MSSLLTKVRVGSLLNHIPYSMVPGIGGVYNHYAHQIEEYKEESDKKEWIFQKTYRIVEFAINNIPFYKDLYKKKGFSLEQLRTFEDIERIPIVTKKNLMETPLEYRSVKTRFSSLANTGGSSGVPLSFYKEKKQKVKEMAYYHHAWSHLGYEPSDLRLQLIGRSNSEHVNYDITRNRLTANVYMPFDMLLKELERITPNKKVPYLQGYPSVIYELTQYIKANPHDFTSSGLRGMIKGIFFNSEYPFPEYRREIEDVFQAKTIASYGHTEGCVVAFDFGDEEYQVEQAYGYAEVKDVEGELHLLGTSYDNFISPFIRYDTSDIVDNMQFEAGILKSFRMTDGGRSGQYVTDKNGKRISLTGLIFGRHHSLFNYCSQMQISQTKPGFATVYYVTKEGYLDGKEPKDLFDTENIEIDFEFKRIDNPIRTKAGKVLLLVPSQVQL